MYARRTKRSPTPHNHLLLPRMPNMNHANSLLSHTSLRQHCAFWTYMISLTNSTITEGYKSVTSIRQDVLDFHTGAMLTYQMSTMG